MPYLWMDPPTLKQSFSANETNFGDACKKGLSPINTPSMRIGAYVVNWVR